MHCVISIHALLAESDNSSYGALDGASISIHALLAESDVSLLRKITITVDISIHALLAESDVLGIQHKVGEFISIHALLAESDGFGPAWLVACINFYPRSPCGERRYWPCVPLVGRAFLSTLSLRRATIAMVGLLMFSLYFYPRSPCGERLLNPFKTFIILTFLSTLSLRRATANAVDQILPGHISIHALLAESDENQSEHCERSK